MKRFILSLCFAALLGGSLVSCSDEAAEITPVQPDAGYLMMEDSVNPGEKGGTKKPGGN